jgi:hypothetical protein
MASPSDIQVHGHPLHPLLGEAGKLGIKLDLAVMVFFMAAEKQAKRGKQSGTFRVRL